MNINKTDKKWLDNLTILKLFCALNHRFPKSVEKYNDINIGSWFMNQRKAFNNSAIELWKINKLDGISPLWKGSYDDLKLFENELIAVKIANYAIDNKQTPITEMIGITKKELNNILKKGIKTCEELVEHNKISMDTKYRAIATIKKDKTIYNYLKLLSKIKAYRNFGELREEIELNSLKNNINMALSNIGETERKALSYYFGLINGKQQTLRETGDLIGLSYEGVRQAIQRGLDDLRDPSIFLEVIIRESDFYNKA